MVVSFSYTDNGTYHSLNTSGSGTITDNDIYVYMQSKEITDGVAVGTYMTKTGTTGAYIYTLKLQSGELYSRWYQGSGVTWQREAGATWSQEYYTGSGTYYVFYINSGSTLITADDCVFDFGPGLTLNNSNARAYILLYGTIISQQTTGHDCVWKKYRSMYCYMYDTTPWLWNNVTLTETSYTGGYTIYFYAGEITSYDGTQVAHSFKNVHITEINDRGYVYFRQGDYSKWILENWINDGGRIQMSLYNVGSAKFVGWEMKNGLDYNRHLNNGYALAEANIHTSKVKDFGANGNNQPFVVFEDCIWDDLDSGVYNMMAQAGGLYLIKDGTFKNAQRGLYANDSTIMLYGTQTYTNITSSDKTWAGQGTFLHVRKLDLTINGSDGLPLENASINIQTKLTKTVGSREYPYEQHQFITDENGQVKGMVEDSIYLTEKEETSNGVFAQWSDGTGDKVHVITISHPDYALETFEIAMTEDRTVVKQMSENNTQTIITDATITDSTIN